MSLGHRMVRQSPIRHQDGSWGHILLLGCIIAGGTYWLLRPSPINKVELPVLPAGWMRLASCEHTMSLDGNKLLDLSDDHRAALEDHSRLNDSLDAEIRFVSGQWSYDEASNRYAITIAGETTTYSLVSSDEGDVCMLIKGELSAADLRASWFSFPSKDDLADYGYKPASPNP